MPARGNAKAVTLGPGYLYHGTLGATEPADMTAAWPVAFTLLGYTDKGSSFTMQTSFDDVDVAEELELIDSAATGRALKVEFDLAEVTADNLKRAMNGGTITTGTGFKTFEPPDLGTETYCALGFESEDHEERWVWRQSKQTGNIQMERRKGAAKTLVPCSFTVYKPATGVKPFKAMFADARTV